MTVRRVELSQPPDVTWDRVQQAFADLGKIEETHPESRYLVGKARYGLNPVRLRVAVLSGAAEGTAVLEIQGRGQDILGVASRKVIDRLVAAI